MTIAENLAAVYDRIDKAKTSEHQEVALLAVSKTFPESDVREAFAAGQKAFGENYVQEGVEKIIALSDLDIDWHFIGPLQSNKAKLVAEHFDWIHSVDRLKIAQRLSALRPEGKAALQVCLQINVSGEASKSGISPDELLPLAAEVARLPNLRLRGLMAIPEPTDDLSLLASRFALLRQLKDRLNRQGFMMDTLSMGMSDDMETAIAEGSTMVRVGSAIFGHRLRKPVLIRSCC
jgi:pyridoxal phosphate enzyme (YggS family)